MIWVAEVGSAHKGCKSLAYEYIRSFSQAGADIVKFQFGWTREAQERQGLEYNPLRYCDEWAPALKRWCESYDVSLMASIWSQEGLDVARRIGLEFWKTSVLLNDEDLRKLVSDEPGIHYDSGQDIYVCQNHPTYPPDLHLPQAFGWDEYYGYSDHCHGIEACLLAVARGAQYIEKHVCLDKSDLATRDTPFSATPAEFEQMVRIGNGIRRLLDED
jgi:sialic acid synthase SpsE